MSLADWAWVRTVDPVGATSLADHNVSVGKAYAGQAVTVVYDLAAHAFRVRAPDREHAWLQVFTLDVISPAYIMGLA